jgi:hypothetical protein
LDLSDKPGIAKKARILPLLAWFWNAQFEQIAQKIAKYSLLQFFEWIHCLQTKIGANFGAGSILPLLRDRRRLNRR